MMSNCFHPDVQLLLASFNKGNEKKWRVYSNTEYEKTKSSVFCVRWLFVSPFPSKQNLNLQINKREETTDKTLMKNNEHAQRQWDRVRSNEWVSIWCDLDVVWHAMPWHRIVISGMWAYVVNGILVSAKNTFSNISNMSKIDHRKWENRRLESHFHCTATLIRCACVHTSRDRLRKFGVIVNHNGIPLCD